MIFYPHDFFKPLFMLIVVLCMLFHDHLSQVGHLGEAYQEWVHQPIVSKEGPRFFESDFWEVEFNYLYILMPLVSSFIFREHIPL